MRHAEINDVTVRQELQTGYRLVAVDGKPVQRLKSSVNTVIPFAVVPPGNHTLGLEPDLHSDKPRITISADLAEGKRYRFAAREQGVVVVEDVD